MNRSAQSNRPRPARCGRSGFTLAELLVVIGIIAVLIAILLPVVNRVKSQGWRADSLNQINVLRSAVDAYHMTFNGYPGVFSNDQIQGPAPVPTVQGISGRPTMSENLMLSLVGGLRSGSGSGFVFQINPNVSAANPTPFGKGPVDLNPRVAKTYAPFVDTALTQSSFRSTGNAAWSGKFREVESGRSVLPDTEIPEFVDRYPQNPLPVLYYRARVGAAGPQQYSAAQNIAYTATPTDGVPAGPLAMVNGVRVEHGLHADQEGPNTAPLKPFPVTTGRGNPLLPYLRNPSTPRSEYVPRGKDSYVLISAGADRIYGTNDDLTSFGNVE